MPEGYVSGPAAATEATVEALERVVDAITVILVEGVSDQIAVETLARSVGIDLLMHRIAVVPTGGAHAISRYTAQLGPAGEGRRVMALCDTNEVPAVRRALAGRELELIVCNADLEDELIRALTPERVVEVLGSMDMLRSFRTMQSQPAWAGKPIDRQLRRFFSSGATRKSQAAAALVADAAARGCTPAPLQRVLDAAIGVS